MLTHPRRQAIRSNMLAGNQLSAGRTSRVSLHAGGWAGLADAGPVHGAVEEAGEGGADVGVGGEVGVSVE